MDEAERIEKLRLVEALFGGAGSEGKRVAAERARERILERLGAMEKEDPPAKYGFAMSDMWTLIFYFIHTPCQVRTSSMVTPWSKSNMAMSSR